MSHSITKQPAERYPLAVDFAGGLPEGASLVSGVLLAVNLKSAGQTTLSASSAVGVTTLSLPIDPKVGAILTLDPSFATREEVQVLSVAGAGPYTVTLTAPLEQAHANAAAVLYFPGTQTVLQSAIATISGTQAVAGLKGGQHGSDYRVTFLITLDTGDVLEEDVTLSVKSE